MGNSMTISEILYKLLGEIEPYGDTNIDKDRYKNVYKYYEALSFILYKIQNCAKFKYRQEISIQKIALECDEILKEFGMKEE